jgi:TM2 domain-containing membrane protein YozV
MKAAATGWQPANRRRPGRCPCWRSRPYAAATPPTAYGQVVQYHQVQPHSAALSVVASFFIPGLGSMLNEKVGKGIGILACYIVAVISIAVLVGFVLAPAVWIWGMVAANNDAHKQDRTHGILSWRLAWAKSPGCKSREQAIHARMRRHGCAVFSRR